MIEGEGIRVPGNNLVLIPFDTCESVLEEQQTSFVRIATQWLALTIVTLK
jgi:hypothetical protein